MNNYKINRSYAKALHLLATERQAEERVAADMRIVSQVCAENSQLRALFANPTLKAAKKAAIAKALFAEQLSAESLAFISFVVRKNRSVNLRGIAEEYLVLYRKSHNIVLAHLVTNAAVDAEVEQAMAERVAQHTGSQVELHATTDSRLLGGYKLEFDNMMYDASLSTKVRKLRLEFAKNEYQSKL